MSGLRAWLAGLPRGVRWSLLGVVLLLVGVVAVSGFWSWQGRREAAAQQALAPVLVSAQQALTSREKSSLDGAANSLNQFLKDHPRSRVATEAWYLLAQVEYQRRQWDAAQAAFAEASRRGSETIGALSQLGLGYTYEARGEPARALEAYRQGLVGRESRDFLYGDFLLAKARAQEQTKDALGAVETYRRFLKDQPTSKHVEEVRIRLALLGAAS